MKERPLGCARNIHDVIQAPALEAVPVEFFKGGMEDFPSRSLWRFDCTLIH